MNKQIVDLDQLLYGQVTLEEIQDYFRYGDFDDEVYLIKAIKRHLMDNYLQNKLNDLCVSISEILNGRVDESRIDPIIYDICFDRWNTTLGFERFKF